MKTIKILSVNRSDERGIIKKPVSDIELTQNGIAGDTHEGNCNRHVSLLDIGSFKRMEPKLGRMPSFGEFAEDITTEGFQLFKMKPLDRLKSGSLTLEITQIGIKCNGKNCVVYKESGECIMQTEGVIARVIEPGDIKPGDLFEYHPKLLRIGIITVSDRASRGEYEDHSGPLLVQLLHDHFDKTGRQMHVERSVVPDESSKLKEAILRMIAMNTDILFTTGGTGLGPRDITPETVRPLLDKEIPGIMEMIRVKYGMEFYNALLSRSIAGVIQQTLVYVLPGSPGAIKEYCNEILKSLEHSLFMIHGLGHK
jgi:molybdopterin adenylyltransferase